MLIRRSQPPLSSKGRVYNTTYLWCSDGWTYDPIAKIRRKYELAGHSLFKMTEEPIVKTVFSDTQYTEEIEVTLISQSPKVWIERGTDISDMFEEVSEVPPVL